MHFTYPVDRRRALAAEAAAKQPQGPASPAVQTIVMQSSHSDGLQSEHLAASGSRSEERRRLVPTPKKEEPIDMTGAFGNH